MRYEFRAFCVFLSLFTATSATADSYLNGNKILGGWKLKYFLILSETGAAVPFCGGISGQILYEGSGHMSVAINCGESDPTRVPADDYGRMLFYSGEFKARGSRIAHRISNSSEQTLIGKTVFRDIQMLTNDTLILTGPFGNQGQTLRIKFTRGRG